MKAATFYPDKYYMDYIISIHAAREGGDFKPAFKVVKHIVISIHAAREGGDMVFQSTAPGFSAFQSTPPVKAATYKSFNLLFDS